MKNQKLISVIIPYRNCVKHISSATKNIVSINKKHSRYLDFILVNDNSTDSSSNLIEENFQNISNIKILSNPSKTKTGPGIGRNIGLENSDSKYILFLDIDDIYDLENFSQLIIKLSESNANIIGFDWKRMPDKSLANYANYSGRNDYNIIKNHKQFLIDYLSLKTDGSVIYNAYNLNFLKEKNLFFREGLHEDIDFAFKSYFLTQSIEYLPIEVYFKKATSDSIVNTFTMKHLEGFLDGYKEIINFCQKNDDYIHFIKPIADGVIAAIATRYREYIRNIDNQSSVELKILIRTIHSWYENLTIHHPIIKKEINNILLHEMHLTKYQQIFQKIINHNINELFNEEEFIKDSEEILQSSWSCIDLHKRLYLRANEVRTCCKRFFYKGEMKGDVVLFQHNKNMPSISEIESTKNDLYKKINKSEECECSGCPFLEYKKWNNIDPLDIDYISVENHSVCNLRCSYCSPEYYGGNKPNYNILELIQALNKHNSLKNLKVIVWGGGEPTLGDGFIETSKLLRSISLTSEQRFLSNSLNYSVHISKELESHKALLCTSIDAGTDETFKFIRGRSKGLETIFENLKKYQEASASPSKVIIKYILDDSNLSEKDLNGFVKLIDKYSLNEVCFQISSNFKEEQIPPSKALKIVELYYLLWKRNCKNIYLDDLIIQRLKLDNLYESIQEFSKDIETSDHTKNFFYTKDDLSNREICLWGYGKQTQKFLNESILLKGVNHVSILMNNTNFKKSSIEPYHMKKFSISLIYESNIPNNFSEKYFLVPSAVQGYATMSQKIKSNEILKNAFKGKLFY